VEEDSTDSNPSGSETDSQADSQAASEDAEDDLATFESGLSDVERMAKDAWNCF